MIPATSEQKDSREVVRCYHCQLVQFVTASRNCRRCNRLLSFVLPASRSVVIDFGRTNSTSPAGCVGEEKGQPNNSSRPRYTKGLDGGHDLGGGICALRDSLEMTQEELAKAAGVQRTYVSRIENRRVVPGPVMLFRILRVLGCSLAQFLNHSRSDEFWDELAGYFEQLEQEQKRLVLDSVKAALEPVQTSQPPPSFPQKEIRPSLRRPDQKTLRILERTCAVFNVAQEELLRGTKNYLPKLAALLLMRRNEVGFNVIAQVFELSVTEARIAVLEADAHERHNADFAKQISEIVSPRNGHN